LSFNYDGGKGFRSSLTFFDTRYKDKITNTGSQPLDVDDEDGWDDTDKGDIGSDGKPISVYFNLGKATLRGVELSTEWDINKAWSTKASYTYTDSEVHSAGKIYDFDLSNVDGGALVNTPRHLVDASLNLQMSNTVSSYVSGVYRGKELQAISLGGVPGIGNDTMTDSFQMNVGVGWNVTKEVLLSAAVYNLTDDVRYDPNDTTTEQYIEDGRRYWLSVNWTI